MLEKSYQTSHGTIHYWTGEYFDKSKETLIFLPGLTADHRLFDKQLEYFAPKYNVMVWDAPGHAASRPFKLDFSIRDKATWLDEILTIEGFIKPILIGQSMGGYVGQTYLQFFPGKAGGLICIDSSPLAREYHPGWVIWSLKHVEPIYHCYPWKKLVKDGAKGCATTAYGLELMADMMHVYDDDPSYYCKLVGHGYRILAQAIELDLPYEITCPALLICGEKDRAGSAKKLNIKWQQKTGLKMEWIPGAGHNSNTDDPELTNKLLEQFVNSRQK